MNSELAKIVPALQSLQVPPQPPGWNHRELHDLLGTSPGIPAAVLVPLRVDPQGVQILFTRRNADLRQHAGQVSFPGGSCDPDDGGPVATALRECAEEIGLPAHAVQPLGFLDCLDTISGFCVTPVVAEIDVDFQPHPNPEEVAEVFEVPLAEFLDPSRWRSSKVEYLGTTRTLHEFDFPGPRIWGATAAILVNLVRRVSLT